VPLSAYRLWVAAILALSLSACSGLKTYPNTQQKNALIRVRTDPGTLLSRIGVEVDLYSVDAGCGTTYLGSLVLRDATIDLGLPLDSKVLLAYVFSRSAVFGTSGTTTIEMMVTPRRGERYEFNVAYLKEGYTATGLQFAPGQAQGKDIEHARLRDCTPAKPAR
jgi:hypothetical protein